MATGFSPPFQPFNVVAVNASTTASNASLPPPGNSLWIENPTGSIAFIQLGTDLTVTATTSSFPVPPGEARFINIGSIVSTVSVLLSTGNGTVYFSRGEGVRSTYGTLPGPTMDYQFLTTSVLDDQITFTRASTGTYLNSSGMVASASSNVPRFDYDPVLLTPIGLLMEPQRTNLCYPSTNRKSNTTPSGSVDGVTQNVGTAPDGTNTAMAFIPGTFSSSAHQQYVNFAGVFSTTYAYSVFVKAAGYNYCRIDLENTSFPTSEWAYFNITAGSGAVTTQPANGTATIQAYPNGWYRLSVQNTSGTSGSNWVANIVVYSSAGPVAFTGDGVSGIWVWGNQVEAGSYPTSYVPTTSAAATRAIDVASSSIGNWYNPTLGTLQAEYSLIGINGTYGTAAAFVGSNSGTDCIMANSFTGGPKEEGGGIVTADVSDLSAVTIPGPQPNVVLGSVLKAALSWGSTVGMTVPAAYNGTVYQNATLADSTLPTITALNIMGSAHYQAGPAGHIRRIRYWPRLLSTAELAQVTT